MFETIMWWGFGIGLFCQCWVALTSGGEKTPGQELMDTRVSNTGVRYGAVLDAMNSNARGREPTNWR